MATFMQKLRTVTLGSVHDLLDKTIDLNSPSALRQYTRDLEEALNKMKDEAAIQAGQVRTLTRQIKELTSEITTKKETLARILASDSPTKEAVAKNKAAEVLRLQKDLNNKGQDLQTQTQTSQDLDLAVLRLEGKHEEIVNQVHRLENMDRETKSKEQAATALNHAHSLIATGTGISIDDVTSKMQARNDVAQEKFSRAMGAALPEEEANPDVDELLNELRPKETTTA